MTEIIATSKVPIHEETSKEKYLRAQKSLGLKNYVARDLTVDEEITDLYEQLQK